MGLDSHLLALTADVPGHVFVDVLEHGFDTRQFAGSKRAVTFGFLLGGPHFFFRRLFERGVVGIGPFAERDQMLFGSADQLLKVVA